MPVSSKRRPHLNAGVQGVLKEISTQVFICIQGNMVHVHAKPKNHSLCVPVRYDHTCVSHSAGYFLTNQKLKSIVVSCHDDGFVLHSDAIVNTVSGGFQCYVVLFADLFRMF